MPQVIHMQVFCLSFTCIYKSILVANDKDVIFLKKKYRLQRLNKQYMYKHIITYMYKHALRNIYENVLVAKK